MSESPFEGVVKLDPGDRDFKTYKEILLFAFTETLKNLPPNLDDWPANQVSRRAILIPVPGHEKGIIMDLAITKIIETIETPELKA